MITYEYYLLPTDKDKAAQQLKQKWQGILGFTEGGAYPQTTTFTFLHTHFGVSEELKCYRNSTKLKNVNKHDKSNRLTFQIKSTVSCEDQPLCIFLFDV